MSSSTPKKNPEVSIIISVYNAEKRIEKVIDALLKQNYKSYEIILVDDGSNDNSLYLMKKIASKNRKLNILTQKNKGAAAGRNLGIKNARGRYLVLTDDDVILEKDWLKKTIPLLKKDNKLFVISIIKNNRPKDMNYFENLLFDYAMASRMANKNNEGLMFMTNAFSKKEAEKAGLYDVNFGGSAAGADIDLWIKMRNNGCKLVFSKSLSTHLEEQKRFRLGFFIKKPFVWGQSLNRLFRKHHYKGFIFTDLLLVVPIPLIMTIMAIILLFIDWRFITLWILGFVGYSFIRFGFIKNLIQRKRNIFEIIFLIVLDITRVLIYNAGSISAYVLNKRKYKS